VSLLNGIGDYEFVSDQNLTDHVQFLYTELTIKLKDALYVAEYIFRVPVHGFHPVRNNSSRVIRTDMQKASNKM